MRRIILLGLSAFPVLGYSQTEEGEPKVKEIEEVVFQKKAKSTDLTNVQISSEEAKVAVTVSGGVETLLKTLPSVNSNAELSSQYMVRGGNFDENLTYINDVEILRPLLIRNSQQEGMSIINPDMVSTVNFSAGGFEAKYGDKMSSVLNIYYRQPRGFELSGEASLIGGRLTLGMASKDQKLSALFGARYRNTNLVLNTLNENTDFNPKYFDFQTYINYKFNPKWSLSFLGYWMNNIYEMRPKERSIDFGTLQNPITLDVYYDGREEDKYKNMMGTVSLNFIPNEKWAFSWDNFAYQNREREYYTISSAFRLFVPNASTGYYTASYDIGGQTDHARNDVLLRTFGSQFKVKFSPSVNTKIEVGAKIESEKLQDATNEWRFVSYSGYSFPIQNYPLGVLNSAPLNLNYSINGMNDVSATRFSVFAQYSKKFLWDGHKMFVNAGARVQNWSFNKEFLFSPRFQLAVKPDWETDMLFRFAAGVYYQAPYYREIKSLDGSLDSSIKAQKSLHFVLANDYEFAWKDRPFKLTTELYYKKMSSLMPYYMDNMRIRYSGKNNAKGYAYGVDARLFGEFVPGVDSWISVGYSRIYENIDNKGFIPRPTDQRFRVSMFYQDYMPKFPSMRVNLTLVYASGLPTGTPILFNADGTPNFDTAYHFQKTLTSYKRVDIGLTKIFIDQKDHKPKSVFWSKFKELSLGVQVFNVFNIHNTVANQWINDIETGYYYPVPVRLTGRFFNAKLEFKF